MVNAAFTGPATAQQWISAGGVCMACAQARVLGVSGLAAQHMQAHAACACLVAWPPVPSRFDPRGRGERRPGGQQKKNPSPPANFFKMF
jgi:hypothetical protein